MQESRRNRRKYERAQELIRSGVIQVDPYEDVIISRKTGQPISLTLSARGYPRLGVWLPEVKRQYLVFRHLVIWECVHGPVSGDLEINHKDGVKTNCKISNLEDITQHENILHAHRTGLWPSVIRSSLEGEMITALMSGLTQRQVAAQFNVGAGTVHRVNARRPAYVPPQRDPNRTHKVCPGCQVDKLIDEFPRARGRFDGRSAYCQPCSTIRHRAYIKNRLLDLEPG